MGSSEQHQTRLRAEKTRSNVADVASGAQEEKGGGSDDELELRAKVRRESAVLAAGCRDSVGGLRLGRSKGNVLYVLDVNMEMHLCS